MLQRTKRAATPSGTWRITTMQNDFLKNFESMNKVAIESAKRLGDLNMRTFEKLAARNLEVAADYLNGSVQQLKLMGESTDVQSAVKEQARLSTELNEKFVAHAKKTAEVLNEIKGEFTDWAQDGMKAVATPAVNGSKKAA
jgi:phasin family protein